MRNQFLVSFCLVTSVLVQPIWAEETMQVRSGSDYLVLAQPVKKFLGTLARDVGLRIDVSAAVEGHLVDVRLKGDVDEILTRIAATHDLDWFMFNGTYFVSDKSEAMTRLTRLGSLKASVALAALDEAGLMLDRYHVDIAAEGTALAISGPPRYLAFSEAVIESIPAPTEELVVEPRQTITVRRGVATETVVIE